VPDFSPWSDNSIPHDAPNNGRAPAQRISDAPEFHSLRRAQRRFGLRATLLSVGGFLVFVLVSHFAPDAMNTPLIGHFTLGLALGLGQFVAMGVTAWCYTRHMRTRVDPLARGLSSRLHQQENRPSPAGTPRPAADQAVQSVQPGSREYRTW
jgi:uncharacterized membrane protein (DUF485 family)